MKPFATDSLQRFCCAIFTLALMVAAEEKVHAQQWLVLRNGQNIAGRVVSQGDSYSVLTDNGSRIVIPGTQVNFVAESIRDIYWDKWSRVDSSDPQSHQKLFRWCLDHGLFEEAQQQINLLAKLDGVANQSGHLANMASELAHWLDQRQQQVELAKQQDDAPIEIRRLPPLPGRPAGEQAAQQERPQLAIAPTIPSIMIDAEGQAIRRLPFERERPQSKPEVLLVDFEEELPGESASARREKPAWVSSRTLDREVRQMPKGTVSFYKRHIESHLISNCIGCHDARSPVMPLSKRSVGQTIPRRMSQQNLHFVMQQVDRQKPFESSLYAMATTAHGDQESPSFVGGDPFLFELRKWSVAVSEDPAQWLMQLSEESQPPPATSQTLQAGVSPAVETVEQTGAKATTSATATAEPTKLGAQGSAADPYDPSVFNRN